MKHKGLKDFIIFFLVSISVLGSLGTLIYFGSKNNPSRDETKEEQLSTVEPIDIESKSTPAAGPIRKPAVAGQFYPEDTSELLTELTTYLDKAELVEASGKVRILFAPHAGTVYSGEVASWGFKQIQDEKYTRVILLGASHKAALNQAAVYPEGSWETPLGSVNVDNAFTKKLIEPEANIVSDAAIHTDEHSLEMELIFLQSVLDNFKIVPILLGNVNEELLNILSYKLAYLMDDETLIVVSTDLSHYPNWEDANYSDSEIIDSIITGKTSEFVSTYSKLESENITNLSTCACGHEAIKVALAVGELLKLNDYKNLKYANSGDVSGDKDRVVGYVSIGAWSSELPELLPDEKTQDRILEISRKTLESYVKTGQIPTIQITNPYLHLPIGVFTTLRINENLRGCIGEFEPNQPLYKVIQSTTVSSASKDIRFTPVKQNELPNISIEISLMTPRRKVDSWKDIVIGEDGVVLTNTGKSGTFLPQVATENDWGLTKFLEELCTQKTGLNKNCYMDKSTTIQTFKVKIISEKEES